MNATIDVLKAMQDILKTFELEFTELDWGTARYKKTGRYMPEDGLEILKKFDAGLFGTAGAPGIFPCRLFLRKQNFDSELTAIILRRCSRSYISVATSLGNPWSHAALG